MANQPISLETKMRRVLILGTGQVGTFAARTLAEKQAFVVAADLNPTPGYFWRYGPKTPTELLKADILESKAISTLIDRYEVDSVVLSAGTTTQACAQNPERGWQVNVEGANNLAKAVLGTSVNRIVFLSTFAVYGRPAANPISESTPLSPQSEYGRCKAVAENIFWKLSEQGIGVVILRPCGTYGPLRLGVGSQSAQLIESLVVGAINHLDLKLKAFPTTSDEYIYVKDLARAIALATLSDINGTPHIFNVGAGRKTTAEELCATLRALVPGASVQIQYPEQEEIAALPPLDISTIEKALGFTPQFELAKGLADYVTEAGFR